MSERPVRNIGILAHVDAGKTTLTEHLLYAAGAIRRVGSVDEGTANTDSMEVERERGISVRAASTALEWNDVSVRIVDTPGHADFYAEVERSLRVLDGAVLVVSSVEGIQLQTLTIWSALRELRIPTIIFVNKLDRVGAHPADVLRDMHCTLSGAAIPLQTYGDIETKAPFIRPASQSAAGLTALSEHLAEVDDGFLARYARDEAVSWPDIDRRITDLTRRGTAYPVFFGAAMLGVGVPEVLDAIVKYLPPPKGAAEKALSALVFKIEASGPTGRATHVRVFEGRIDRGHAVANETNSVKEKVTRITQLTLGGAYENVDTLTAGDIGALYGLRLSKIGHILGSHYAIPDVPTPTEPMLSARIVPDKSSQWNDLLLALRQLEDEDPLLSVEWLDEQREISVRFFGEVQMEIIRDLLRSRFNIGAKFSDPVVIYKETPSGVGESYIDYRTHGYALLHVRVEPLPLGSGVHFASHVKAEKIYHKFMKQIPEILEVCRRKGPLGWEVTDFRFTVLDGHSKYDLGTQPGDFKIVTPMAFADALRKCGTRLLEPMMDFHISVPERYAPQVFRDLIRMRATVADPGRTDGVTVYTGRVPFAETFKYTAVLYASSHGQGILRTKYSGYAPLDRQEAL